MESDHGRFGGAALAADGLSSRSIVGPALDGYGGATLVADTDGGRLDGDPVYDRAVGPMQFIPSTWARYGADGTGDGRADSFNIYDAARAAASYLCAAGSDLASAAGQARAALAYNDSQLYVATVLALASTYGEEPVHLPPVVPGPLPPVQPANPAPPPALAAQPQEISAPSAPSPGGHPARPTRQPAPNPAVPKAVVSSPSSLPTRTSAATPTPLPTPTSTSTSSPPTPTPTPGARPPCHRKASMIVDVVDGSVRPGAAEDVVARLETGGLRVGRVMHPDAPAASAVEYSRGMRARRGGRPKRWTRGPGAGTCSLPESGTSPPCWAPPIRRRWWRCWTGSRGCRPRSAPRRPPPADPWSAPGRPTPSGKGRRAPAVRGRT